MPLVYEAVALYLKKTIPQVEFDLTQDQSTLLNAGIDTLQTQFVFWWLVCLRDFVCIYGG